MVIIKTSTRYVITIRKEFVFISTFIHLFIVNIAWKIENSINKLIDLGKVFYSYLFQLIFFVIALNTVLLLFVSRWHNLIDGLVLRLLGFWSGLAKLFRFLQFYLSFSGFPHIIPKYFWFVKFSRVLLFSVERDTTLDITTDYCQ